MEESNDIFTRIVVTKNELDLNTPICQYIDIQYLSYILLHGKYYVRKKKYFKDPLETNLPLKKLFYFKVAGKNTSSINKKYEFDKEGLDFHKCSSEILTSCWTKEITENILWWDRGKNEYKFCIKTTINNFLASFKQKNMNIICGEVEYDGISPYQDKVERLFIKQKMYANEKEIRFYFLPKEFRKNQENLLLDNCGCDFLINPNIMIDEIVLSPYIQQPFARLLMDFIKYTVNISVKQSPLSC